jgi:CheY-like chemotaxis protein
MEISKGFAMASRRPAVLAVDDDAFVLGLIRCALEPEMEVLTAESGTAALDVVRTRTEPIDVLLCDITMPGLTGIETARRVQAARSGIQVILISGYSAHGTVGATGWGFLRKPFTPSELSAKIKTSLSQSAAKLDPEHLISLLCLWSCVAPIIG